MPDDALLRTVCDEMPPFSERASILLQRLHKKSVGTSERRTWVVGGKDANADKQEVLLAQNTGSLKRTFTGIVHGAKGKPNGTNGANGITPGRSVSGSSAFSTNGASKDLEGLDMNNIHEEPSKARNLASAVHLTPDWDIGYNNLYFADEGILFQDSQIQIGVRSEYRAHIGVLKLYFTNKASFSVGSFTTTLDNPSAPNLKVDTKSLPENSIEAGGQTQQTIYCTATGPFANAPTIRISYLAGALQAYTLRLPILPHRYMDPSELSAEDFFKRWRQIGAGDKEAQSTFGLNRQNLTMDDAFTRQTVTGFKWKILDGVDPNLKNLVGCAVFQMEKGKAGCLLRLEPNGEQKVCLHFDTIHFPSPNQKHPH